MTETKGKSKPANTKQQKASIEARTKKVGNTGNAGEVTQVGPLFKQPPTLESINAEADRIINGQRREDYGSAEESFARIATGWEVIMGVPVSAHQVVLCMVWLKTCRALQGYHRDSFVDICGYAGLAEVLSQRDGAAPVDGSDH